jgi:hypothetical protein
MDVRIGLSDSPQVIEIEMENDTDRDAIRSDIEAALSGDSKVLWLSDRKGSDYAVPSDQIGFVEIGTSDAERRIGFGA